MPFKTVISVFVPQGKPSFPVARSLGDYLFGVPEEDRPAYPSIGLSFKKFKGLENIVVDTKPIDGVARNQDFEKGDIVLGVDGREFEDTNELRTYLAKFKWDDEVKFRLLRNAAEKEVALKFKEMPAPPAEAKK
jgi:S1-C subfamily serine protease